MTHLSAHGSDILMPEFSGMILAFESGQTRRTHSECQNFVTLSQKCRVSRRIFALGDVIDIVAVCVVDNDRDPASL